MRFVSSKTGLNDRSPAFLFYKVAPLLIALLFFISGCASVIHIKKTRLDTEIEGKVIAAEDTKIEPASKKLKVGEKLVYRLAWIGVPVGIIRTEVKEIVEINGYETFHVVLTVKTNLFCSAIYKIDDRFETYMDTKTMLPIKHKLKRREGRHKKDYTVDFDHTRNIATYHNLREKTTKEVKFPKGSHDPLSAIYFYRMQDVDVGDKLDFHVNLNEKDYRVTGEIEKKEIVQVPEIGVYDAFLTRPQATLNGEEVKKGKAIGYVSCDSSRIPLFGVVDVWVRLIGRITLTLGEIH